MNRSHVRRGAAGLATVLVVALTGCGGDGPTDPNGGGGGGGPTVTTSVTVVDNNFQPSAIQVSPGATVTWTWSGTTQEHNVTFSTIAVSSGDQDGGTFQAAMPNLGGTYNYSCTIHAGMNGSVLVM